LTKKKNSNRCYVAPVSKTTLSYQVTLAGFAVAIAIAPSSAAASPTMPNTDDTTWRYQSPPKPGWSNINGSCDTSSANTYGLEASPLAFNDANLAGFLDASGPLPIAGHTHFASCGTWLQGEGAQAVVSGLTPGENYTISFFVAGFRPIAAHSSRDYEVGNTYRITVGNDTSGYVPFNSTAWIPQTFNFTADSAAEIIRINAEDTSRRSVTHATHRKSPQVRIRTTLIPTVTDCSMVMKLTTT